MSKLFFYETGLCSWLQGHLDEEQVWHAPQVGPLFETLVFSEIKKTILNYVKPWELYCWRTKGQKETDLILETENKTFLIETKFGVQNVTPFDLDAEAKKVFKGPCQKVVVTAGGEQTLISNDIWAVPIAPLAEFLIG